MFCDMDRLLEAGVSPRASNYDDGLDCVRKIAFRMGTLPCSVPSVLVGGTNGKGTCVATLEALARSNGLRPFATQSPHVWSVRERFRFDGTWVATSTLREGLAAVEAASEDMPLTYFERLACLTFWCVHTLQPDVALFEVGLGGRLDAMNAVDADVAVITSIGLDHQALLGSTRHAIAQEKAGIMRPGQDVVCGDVAPPENLQATATALGARWHGVGEAFSATLAPLSGPSSMDRCHPHAIAAACHAWDVLRQQPGLQNWEELRAADQTDVACWDLMCRGSLHEVPKLPVPVLVETAHNPMAMEAMVARYQDVWRTEGRDHAMVAFSADKAWQAMVASLLPMVDVWWCVGYQPHHPRLLPAHTLMAWLQKEHGLPNDRVHCLPAGQGCGLMRNEVRAGDRVWCLGSFFHVADLVPPPSCWVA